MSGGYNSKLLHECTVHLNGRSAPQWVPSYHGNLNGRTRAGVPYDKGKHLIVTVIIQEVCLQYWRLTRVKTLILLINCMLRGVTKQAIQAQRNNEARSRNHFCRGKEITSLRYAARDKHILYYNLKVCHPRCVKSIIQCI